MVERWWSVSKNACGVAAVLAVFGAATFACGDDETAAPPTTPSVDGGIDGPSGPPGGDGGNPTTDGSSDGSADGGPTAFSPKSNCETPKIAVTAPLSIDKLSIAAAPSSPIVLGYGSLAQAGTGFYKCEARTYAAGTWSAPDTTFDQDCDQVLFRVASGGGHALAFSRERLSTVSKRRRTTGGAFADIGAAASGGESREVAIGSAGHVVDTSMGSSGLVTVLYDAMGGNEVPLPANSASSFTVQGVANVVDSKGDGFVVWLTSTPPTVHARAFRSGAWAGNAVPLATGATVAGQTLAMSAALLPNGDAQVVWFNAATANPAAVRGAFVHYDAGSGMSAWNATIDEIDPAAVASSKGKVLADGDGNLTVLWVGNNELHARRRVAGTWGNVESLGSASYLSAMIDPQGHVTAVTFDSQQALYHYRAEKGAAAWQPRVKVNGSIGASDSAGVVLLPSGDLFVVWRDTGTNIYSSICR
jgi:hypothetical protein